MKKFIALFMVMVCVAGVIPVTAQAAEAPAKVMKAVNRCVDENGRCIVIDQKAEKMYLFKRSCNTGKWELKRVFKCIVSEKLCKTKHYFLHRSNDIDIFAWGVDNDRWSYGMYIDCYEKAYTNMIHSYVDHYNGRTWKTRKCAKWNTDGISLCEKNAKWIWENCGDGTAIQVV